MNEEYEKWKSENSRFLHKYIEEEVLPNIGLYVDDTKHTFNLSLKYQDRIEKPIEHSIHFYEYQSDTSSYWMSPTVDITIDNKSIINDVR